MEWLTIRVEQERFQVLTTEAPHVRLCDLVVRTFREFLSHTPLTKLGINLLRQAKHADAETAFAECFEIRRRVLPGNGWRAWNTQCWLGEAITADPARFAEAEQLLIQGHAKLEATLPESRRAVFLPETIERLVKLYQAWDKPEEAEKWRGKLAAAAPP